MSRHNASDSDWHDSEAELPANLRERLLYKQLDMHDRKYRYSIWDNIKDLILVALLLILFTTPIWMPAFGITTS